MAKMALPMEPRGSDFSDLASSALGAEIERLDGEDDGEDWAEIERLDGEDLLAFSEKEDEDEVGVQAWQEDPQSQAGD